MLHEDMRQIVWLPSALLLLFAVLPPSKFQSTCATHNFCLSIVCIPSTFHPPSAHGHPRHPQYFRCLSTTCCPCTVCLLSTHGPPHLWCRLKISEIILLDHYTLKWIKHIYIFHKFWVWMDCEFKFEVHLNPMFPPAARGLLWFKILKIILLNHYIPSNEWKIFIYSPNVKVNWLWIEIWSWTESHASAIHTRTSSSLMLVRNFGNNATWSLYTFEWMKYIYIPHKCSVEWFVNLHLKLIQILCFRRLHMDILISDVG